MAIEIASVAKELLSNPVITPIINKILAEQVKGLLRRMNDNRPSGKDAAIMQLIYIAMSSLAAFIDAWSKGTLIDQDPTALVTGVEVWATSLGVHFGYDGAKKNILKKVDAKIDEKTKKDG